MNQTDPTYHQLKLKQLGKVLRELRIRKGYTSAENFSFDHNFNRTNYWRWEKGQNMTLKNVFKICEIHQIQISEFFGLLEQKNIDENIS